MTSYTALVYPQVAIGQSYTRPAVPSTFGALALTSPAWSPYSSTANDRTEWWEDSAGTLTWDDVLLAAYGLAGVQQQQAATLTKSYQGAIAAVPVTINGTAYALDNAPSRQAQNISSALVANGALSAAKAWVAGATYPTGSYCSVGGVILFALTGGTAGRSAPTPPSTFGTPVTDGTVSWELFGRRVYLTSGAPMFLTAQNLVSAFAQGELHMHNMTNQLETLITEVNAATGVAAVQAVVWP